MVSLMEIEDYFIRKLQGMAVTPSESVAILIKHLRGYVPNGKQLGIASNKFPDEIDEFIEVKGIYNGKVQHMRPSVRDDRQGSTAINKF